MCPFPPWKGILWSNSLHNSDICGVSSVNSIPSVLRTSLTMVSLPVSPLGPPPPGRIEKERNGRLRTTAIFVPVSARNQTPIFPKVTSSRCPRSRLSLILQLGKGHHIQLPADWAVHSVRLSGGSSQSETWQALQFILYLPLYFLHASRHFFIVLLNGIKWWRVTYSQSGWLKELPKGNS